MRSFAKSHPIKTYLILVYVWGAIVFAVPLLSEIGLGVVPINLPGVAPFILLAAVGLAVAGYLVSRWSGKGEAAEFRHTLFRFRVNPLWYLLALTGLPLVGLATAVIGEGMDPLRELLSTPGLLGLAVGAAVVAFVLVNWWEEAGWTGFFLDRFQATMGPVKASVMTTFAQATIHLPLVFITDGVTVGRVTGAEIPLYIGLLFVLPIPVRMVITWIYNSTGRSVPVVGLFHAGLGVATGTDLIPVIAPGFEMLWVYAGFAVAGAVVLAITRGRLGYRPAPTRTLGSLRVSASATPGRA